MNKAHPLSHHMPEAAVQPLAELLDQQPLRFIVSKERSSKLGDYRPPVGREKRHRITVNGSLNKMAFLITSLHEFAHFRHRLSDPKGADRSHGLEWKKHFKEVMQPFLVPEIFPEPLLSVLRKHMQNPRASSTSDLALSEALMAFDPPPIAGWMVLKDLDDQVVFETEKGRKFRKGTRLRSRILCEDIENRRMYRVSPLIKARPL
jgi:SprT protein